jgi:glycine C-acetyltransferase
VDIITGTLGKALGGASGGYVSGRRQIVEMLRQRSRPYLFSNTLAPVIAATSLRVLQIIDDDSSLRHKLLENMSLFRYEMENLGFTLAGKDHPIIPVMLGEADLACQMAEVLLDEGIYVIGFFYPVVPKGQARIRVQLSASHSASDIQKCVAGFAKVGRRFNVIKH